MSGSNSATRILAILDLFSEDRLAWTPEEMMDALGYSRPTVYRYIKSLRDAGLLSSLPTGGFTLGPRVVEMDFLMRKSDTLLQLGQSHLEALVDAFPCYALLTRWYGSKLLCVASECTVADPLSSYPRGRPMPLSHGAISRAIMAHLPRRQQTAMVERLLPEMRRIGLGQSVEDVLGILRGVRRSGVAVAHGEVTPGVVGVAAPVLSEGRNPVASISVTIAGHEVTPERMVAMHEQVRDRAAALSSALDQYGFAVEEDEGADLEDHDHPEEGTDNEENRRIHPHLADALL